MLLMNQFCEDETIVTLPYVMYSYIHLGQVVQYLIENTDFPLAVL